MEQYINFSEYQVGLILDYAYRHNNSIFRPSLLTIFPIINSKNSFTSYLINQIGCNQLGSSNMIKQQYTPKILLNYTFLLVDISTNQVKEIKDCLEQVETFQFEIIHFPVFSDLHQFLEQAPINTSVLLDLSVFNKDTLIKLDKLVFKFPDYNIIILVTDTYREQEIKAIQRRTKNIIFKSDLNGYRLAQMAQKVKKKKSPINGLAVKQTQHYQTIINNAPDAIFLCKMQGELLEYNLATSKLLGIPFHKLHCISIHHFIQSPKQLQRFLTRLQVVHNVCEYSLEIETNDGQIKHCLITAQLVDQINGYTATIKDITEQKKREEFKKSQDLAKKSAKIKEKFLASVSHEMRTPMNAILGMSNLALKTDLNEEQYNYINSIKHSSQILLGVVNDILQISEIQNEKIIFENKDFDLYELLYNLINVMQYKVKEKELSLELILAPNVPQIIRGDQLRLNQILYNLVGNAIKFTDTGQVKIHLFNLNENQYSAQLKFIIQDTGIGIPSEKIETIFESFTRVRSKDRIFEGTGLGLSIAKSLIQQQGGKIGVKSEVGIGSEFFFDLIFEIGDELPLVSVNDNENNIDFDRAFNLLLVEDHKMNQLVARKTLEKQWKNINITIANDGKEAIAILEKQNFDIILMDIQMPKMNGYEATQYIRQEMPESVTQIPILAMTAHAHISQNEEFKQYGMNDFVLKPFDPQQLFQKINQYLPTHKTTKS